MYPILPPTCCSSWGEYFCDLRVKNFSSLAVHSVCFQIPSASGNFRFPFAPPASKSKVLKLSVNGLQRKDEFLVTSSFLFFVSADGRASQTLKLGQRPTFISLWGNRCVLWCVLVNTSRDTLANYKELSIISKDLFHTLSQDEMIWWS